MNEITGAVAALAKSSPRNSNEYLAQDGVYRCRICQEPTRTRISVPGFGDFEPSITCGCDRKKEEMRKLRQREQTLERLRRNCFGQSSMSAWCFENDDRTNPKLSDAMEKYAENFQKFLPEGRGLLLYGTVGTGKSFYAACIANRLLEKGYSAKMTNFATLTNDLSGMGEGKNRYIDELNQHSLLVIDDLGAERKSEYVREIVFNIIDSRYRSGKPMIITTNLTGEELRKPDSTENARIYDRILGCCFPQEINGPSRRRKELKSTMDQMRSMLGL